MDYKSEVRALSRTLFGGAQYRLEVASVLYAGSVFTALDVVMVLGDPPGKGSVHTELKRLREAGLITPAATPQSDRSKPLTPMDTDFWECCRGLVTLAQERGARRRASERALATLASQDPRLAVALDAGPGHQL